MLSNKLKILYYLMFRLGWLSNKTELEATTLENQLLSLEDAADHLDDCRNVCVYGRSPGGGQGSKSSR